MFTDPESGAPQNGIAKVRYTHDAMIDLIIAEPTVQQNQLAQIFDRTPGWICQIMQSDAFRARLEERRKELVDPAIVASINERLAAVADASLQRILEKVTSPVQLVSDDYLLEAAAMATKALGYGARPSTAAPATQVAVVVQVPPSIPSASEWARTYSASPSQPITDA